ncbi:unnamed protein product [Linum trigynum]|uniref:Uncharacterized protein n=1 Tax=Linum trigynum TaxID=586398 RepID=A0AAV2CD32_9ROSI
MGGLGLNGIGRRERKVYGGQASSALEKDCSAPYVRSAILQLDDNRGVRFFRSRRVQFPAGDFLAQGSTVEARPLRHP